MHAILTEALTKLYAPGKGLEALDLQVPEGSLFGFVGPNGAGKTTTIRLLLDFIRPQCGRSRIFGLDCQRESEAVRSRIGFIPGELHLPERYCAAELLRYLEGLRGRPSDRAWVRQVADVLELDTQAMIATLSKGNKQKVALWQALAAQPPLLVMDEPTDGLDPLIQQAIYELLRVYRDRGGTVFMSSHVLSEVERLCDWVAIVRKGRLAACEPVAGLRRRKVRHLEVVFAADVDVAAFAAGLPGAQLLEHHGRTAKFAVTGEADAIARALAAQPLADFTFVPASLEEAFLDYYRSEH
ncbi:MAG: ABC transporter ATP-binding protein [Cyanobacteria bacterium REEB65]|nr:ABC transporter ATP-binding protein [Cyanobacteria bacterium REEB65]